MNFLFLEAILDSALTFRAQLRRVINGIFMSFALYWPKGY